MGAWVEKGKIENKQGDKERIEGQKKSKYKLEKQQEVMEYRDFNINH